ncbi:MAG: hypothetical protein ACJ8DZ_11940 [Allosphingosinicella sp.]
MSRGKIATGGLAAMAAVTLLSAQAPQPPKAEPHPTVQQVEAAINHAAATAPGS